ncbi:MAG: hypothetical protein AAF658_00950 [Myxococcota bacterium]
MTRAFAVFALIFTGALSAAHAGRAGAFSQGSTRVSALLGSGSFAGSRNVIVGADVGYFVLDGLQLSVEGDVWLGNTSLARLSPAVTYTFVMLPTEFIPYAGVFYRRWIVESPFEDLDTVGIRGGVNLSQRDNLYLGVGAAYESRVRPECDVGDDCDFFYPELTLAFAF